MSKAKNNQPSLPFPPAQPLSASAPKAGGNGAAAATASNGEAPAKKPARRLSAEDMGKKQQSIAVSEFFYKNRHLLGFDNPRKALLTTIKEAVDNSLDACEEAGILPDIEVWVEMLAEDRFRVTVQDSGPGIVAKHVGPVFGKLLYGSKFHRLKMSRGQQGIGISAAGMYAMMTTGKSVKVLTRTSPKKPAYYCELQIDTKQNAPVILKEEEQADCPFPHGTRVSMEMNARYNKGRASVDEYLEQTAVANPHANIIYHPPAERGKPADVRVFPRGSQELPPEAKEIKPHPYGVELGTLLKMLQDTQQSGLVEFLTEEFSKINVRTAKQLIAEAGLRDGLNPHDIGTHQAEPLYKAIQRTAWYRFNAGTLKAIAEDGVAEDVMERLKAFKGREFPDDKALLDALKREKALTEDEIKKWRTRLLRNTQEGKLPNPPTDCLAPIGTRQILDGLLKEIKAEFFTAETREPAVYRGMPFQIEVGLAYGGALAETCRLGEDGGSDGPTRYQSQLYRFANRVPLLYQQSACCTFKAATEDVKWSAYDVPQSGSSLPSAPMLIMIHMASVWVPFTSESKEAIADYDAIRDEIKLAVQECGRKLRAYLRRKDRVKQEGDRRSRFLRYIGEVVAAVGRITGNDADAMKKFEDNLLAIATKKTERADVLFDEDGNAIKPKDRDEAPDENTIIVERDGSGAVLGASPGTGAAAAATPDGLPPAPIPTGVAEEKVAS